MPIKSNYRFGLNIESGVFQSIMRLPHLQKFMEANGGETPVTADVHVHIGLGFRLNRVKATFQFSTPTTLLAQVPRNSTKWITRQQGGRQWGIQLGYDLVNGYARRWYVYSGVGVQSIDFTVYRRTGQTIPFGSILLNAPPGGVASLGIRNAPYIDMGIEMSFREKQPQSRGATTRIGYRHGLRQNDYRSDMYGLTDPISDRLSQFYVQTFFSVSDNFSRKTP